MTIIGSRIRDERVKRGWSQIQLSGRVGISSTHISSIERGDTSNLHQRTIVRFANAFGLTIQELSGSDEPVGHEEDNEEGDVKMSQYPVILDDEENEIYLTDDAVEYVSAGAVSAGNKLTSDMRCEIHLKSGCVIVTTWNYAHQIIEAMKGG